MSEPRVLVIASGGTIAMSGPAGGPVVPALEPSELIAAVPALRDAAEVTAVSLRQLPGAHLGFADVAAVAETAGAALRDYAGVVVTQGTDTIEETAFLLDLLLDEEGPVVVTGAMRNPTLAGADGPANLLAAVQVAAAPQTRGLGVLVVMNDEIHAARFVRKTHTQSPAAFRSLPGPLGWVAEGRPRLLLAPRQRYRLPAAPTGEERVALLTATLDDDGALVRALHDFDGLVFESFGGGHATEALADALAAAAQRIPVVLASRTGAGEGLRHTYGFAGSERDLLGRGLLSGGWLDGPKSRILLTVLLRAGLTREQVAAEFERYLA